MEARETPFCVLLLWKIWFFLMYVFLEIFSPVEKMMGTKNGDYILEGLGEMGADFFFSSF